MIYGVDIFKVLTVLGGASFLGFVLKLVTHFFASGADKLGERKRQDENSTTRAGRWESEWKTCEQNRLLELRRRERLSWAYDDFVRSAQQMWGLVKDKDHVPLYLGAEIEAAPDALTIINAVRIEDVNVPD